MVDKQLAIDGARPSSFSLSPRQVRPMFPVDTAPVVSETFSKKITLLRCKYLSRAFLRLIPTLNILKIYFNTGRKVFCKRINQFLRTAITYDVIKLDVAFTFQIRDYLIIIYARVC